MPSIDIDGISTVSTDNTKNYLCSHPVSGA